MRMEFEYHDMYHNILAYICIHWRIRIYMCMQIMIIFNRKGLK